MAYRPDWKPLLKEKWVGQQTFKSESGKFTSKPAWKDVEYRNPHDNNIHIEQENQFTEFKRIRPECLEKHNG